MRQETIAFLRQSPLVNIVPLKMLAAHPEQIHVHFWQRGEATAALLLFSTATFAYDRHAYPDDRWIAILVASQPDAVHELLPLLPWHERIVFKLVDPAVLQTLAATHPLTRVTGFASYTTTSQQLPMPAGVESTRINTTITETETPDPTLYPLFAAHGNQPEDVIAYFATGQARLFTCQVGGEVDRERVAACYTYQNFEQIHEIGGVVTVPTARRKGYAKLVVQAALASLQRRGLTPRYQVHEENLPSVRLAESLGLQRFALVEHWRHTPAEEL